MTIYYAPFDHLHSVTLDNCNEIISPSGNFFVIPSKQGWETETETEVGDILNLFLTEEWK